MLEPSVRPHAIVDLTPAFLEEAGRNRGKLKGCWSRMLMVFEPCFYFITKDTLVFQKAVRGDRKDLDNVFKWEKVILNLPDVDLYDPSIPWV